MNEIDKARLEVMDEVIDLMDDIDTGGDYDWAYRHTVKDMLEVRKEEMLKEINAREKQFVWGEEEVWSTEGRKVCRAYCLIDGERVATINCGFYYKIVILNTLQEHRCNTLDEAKAWVEAQLGGQGK